MVAAGADKNAVADQGQTALLAASSFGHVELARWLLNTGANAACTAGEEGATPLHLACLAGRTQIIRLLCEVDGMVNSTAEQGVTPLHLASGSGNVDMVRALMECRADVNKLAQPGGTALMIAKEAAWTLLLPSVRA